MKKQGASLRNLITLVRQYLRDNLIEGSEDDMIKFIRFLIKACGGIENPQKTYDDITSLTESELQSNIEDFKKSVRDVISIKIYKAPSSAINTPFDLSPISAPASGQVSSKTSPMQPMSPLSLGKSIGASASGNLTFAPKNLFNFDDFSSALDGALNKAFVDESGNTGAGAYDRDDSDSDTSGNNNNNKREHSDSESSDGAKKPKQYYGRRKKSRKSRSKRKSLRSKKSKSSKRSKRKSRKSRK